jgi:hypothetical protein
MFNLTCSFSHDANDAFSASAMVLFVPGVSGGTWVGISATKKLHEIELHPAGEFGA